MLQGKRLVVPSTEIAPGRGNLQQLVVDLANEGHQGAAKYKKLLPSKLWFPKLDQLIDEKVAGCLRCQATMYTPTRDPLKPTQLPAHAWQNLDMDFWGPLPNGEHILVAIDVYSRY